MRLDSRRETSGGYEHRQAGSRKANRHDLSLPDRALSAWVMRGRVLPVVQMPLARPVWCWL
jgi:hypothetical protein